MFRSLLAAAGIGGARVDTQIVTPRLAPGEPFEARIVLTGGKADQTIEGLGLKLCTEVEVEGDNGEYTTTHALAWWPLEQRLELRAGETLTLPLNTWLPAETPLTALPCADNRSRVWLQTDLAIANALDASDRDALRVEPTWAMHCVIEAMQQLGFRLASADVEAGYLQTPLGSSQSGCYQELEFRPAGFGGIAEVEISFLPGPDTTHVLVEIDRRFRGDSYRFASLPHAGLTVDAARRQLAALVG